ncbi:IclR family transcriptional regulator [Pseudoglutamicibacter albus]|uniref:IclR family transcriptional regulator n=1 Tax=Pseudoglutamicibacter albus TaxID=98671 RepID=UPI001EF5E789|nr:IclR family transcriptional regulator [Pseudoglutamicibacter albus]MCG7305085.1 IclR family transcriptional regulator [Pseudoglutamicibacter albus]
MANRAPQRRGNPASRSTSQNSEAPSISVTSRALRILDTFDSTQREQSLSGIARRADLPLATAHRLVNQLTMWGGLEKKSGRYRIGQKLWRIGLLASAQRDVAEVASPYMQDVLFVTHNVVNLFILDQQEVLLVERISGTNTGAPFRRVGERMDLHSSAAGKLMLAYGSPHLLEELPAELPRHTSHTIGRKTELIQHIARIRSQGFATTQRESGENNFAIAVPVFSPATGHIIAGLGIVTQDAMAPIGNVVPVLKIAARGISRTLEVGD